METLKLVLGRYDDPENQRQSDYSIDLYQHNLAVFGSAMSGKTTVLKTLLLRIHQVAKVTDTEEIYILDFSNDLKAYEALPYVTACFDASQEENVRRIFKIVGEKLSRNIRLLKGNTFAKFKVQDNEEEKPRHITFIIDGLNSFVGEDKYLGYLDTLLRFSRDGISKGVSIVFAANEPTGGINRLMTSFSRIIVFELPKDKYSEIFSRKVEKPISLKGRGMANIEMGVYEFQAYFPYNSGLLTQNDASAIQDITEHLYRYGCSPQVNAGILAACAARKLKSFNSDLTKETWHYYTDEDWEDYRHNKTKKSPEFSCGPFEFTAGLDYYELTPIKIDLTNTRSIAIYGKRESGKTNLLSLILETAVQIPEVRFVLWEDGRKGLTKRAPGVLRLLDSMGDRVAWTYTQEEFETYIREKGYYDLPKTMGASKYHIPAEEEEGEASYKGCFKKGSNPFTVFVIQSRLFYQKVPGGDYRQLIPRLSSYISNEDEDNKKLFVFSDVQQITEQEMCTIFNNCIDHAFLLEDMVRFIGDTKGQRSVFGTQDPKDLKERFGPCELGDGFYMNLETSELAKLRFIKQQL